MTFALVFEQLLNGLQFGVTLFLMAAGLTLVVGIMNFINLAHGSLYMIGAYLALAAARWTGSYLAGVGLGLAGTLLVGMLVEVVALRTLYQRDHLDQVLATFGLILFFNELVASGRVKAPIVIGRDHLDCGSVASPNRETEGMLDGSDAIADWPILNAMINAVNGATWVSVHHGGGVGIGYSLHAGMVIVADGTDAAAARLERVLTADPGMGVIRHADAGYERALEVARERGVRVPMDSGS